MSKEFLGAFTNLRKATVGFVMSVRSRGWTRLPLDEVWWNLILKFLQTFVDKIQSFIKNLTRITSTLHEDLFTFMKISRILFGMRKILDKICRETQNTRFIFHNSFPENRAVCEIMSKIVVEPGRPQMTIRRMRCVRWISKATREHTHAHAHAPAHPHAHTHARRNM